MLEFRPMNALEYADFYRQSVQHYAAEGAKSGGWDAEEAGELARQQFEALLPQGLQTPDHHFYTLVATEKGQPVGHLWTMLRGEGEQRHLFIYDIEVEASQQGQGYGTQALELLKTQASAQGTCSIRLHVFGHNMGAIHLYQKMGFYVTNLHMRFDLEPQH